MSVVAVSTGILSMSAVSVKSPDGLTVVNVNCHDGFPTYSINYNGIPFIRESPLGLITDIGDFSNGMSILETAPVIAVSDSYSLPNIKKSHVDYSANRLECKFAKGDSIPRFDVIWEVSNNNVAFKYRIYPEGNEKCCVVNAETTGFIMPEGTTTFLCPQTEPMTGFARTAPSYETSYTVDDSTGKNGTGYGYTFPCLFRNGDNGWILVSETGLDGNYCASRIIGHENGSYFIGYPNPGEMNGIGSSYPGIELPGETPWRTITLGDNLAPIVETTIAFDVVKPKYESSKKYDYTKGTWSWIMRMDPSTNFNVQKEYIDFAAEIGYETVLVDALWDTQIGRKGIEELADYGRGKNVALYLWYNSNGYWNDAPQGPRGIMNNSHLRRKEMKWMREHGIKGIKVDFFGSDKQDMMKLYEDILSDANDYGLLVIFHGCTLPRGWERMFPSYASSEAVRASENLHFQQSDCDNEAFNACLHPFIRNTVGSMDFGGSALNKYWTWDNKPGGNKRMTSDVFAIATGILFQSPVQHFALAPNNLSDAPEWAMDFMKNVPTTWDDIRYIDGYPGQYVVIARRNSDKWYIAGVNAQKAPININVNLSQFFADDKVTLYSDDNNLTGSKKEITGYKNKPFNISIPSGGGIVIVGKKSK